MKKKIRKIKKSKVTLDGLIKKLSMQKRLNLKNDNGRKVIRRNNH